MLSKFLRNPLTLLVPKIPCKCNVRKFWGLIPRDQYEVAYPNKLKFGYAIREYWETIPLFVTTAISFSILGLSILWATKNKVDVVFTTNSRACISRTMDLRNPSVHKIRLINQRYEAWPEMQDVLDKMVAAEKRALVRMQTCSNT